MNAPQDGIPKADTSLLHRAGTEDEFCEGCGAEFYGWWQASRCRDCNEFGDPCRKCGERGTMPRGDESDCRSADCQSSKADAAYEQIRDQRDRGEAPNA